MDIVYLDNAASAPLRPEALEAVSAHLKTQYANPSAIHALGQAARLELERARNAVASLLGADASEIVFVSGATEANTLAICGVVEPLLDAGRKPHAVTTALEHASVLKTFRALEKRGLALTVVPPGKDGVVPAEEVLAAVRPDTALVSVIAVSNELGTRQPVEEIGRALKSDPAKPLFHVDAVQAAVSTDIDFRNSRADLFVVSAHKIGGPKGVGALAVRKGVTLAPILIGGGHEGGRRSGTENASGIAGFGAAAAALLAARPAEAVRYRELRASVLSRLPPGVRPLVPMDAPVAPHILAFECAGKENDWIVLLMSREGVMISAGSACRSGSREASEAVRALGLDEPRARSVIRASFGPMTDTGSVDAFLAALSRSMAR